MAKSIHSTIPHQFLSPSSIELFSPIETEDLPKPFNYIPEHCTNLSQIAKHEIEILQRQEEELHMTASLQQQSQQSQHQGQQRKQYSINEIQNAIDDGFLLCDLNVIRSKLMAWKVLYPRIKPFFAIKCNPDCMVSHILGRTYFQNTATAPIGNNNSSERDEKGTTSLPADCGTNDVCGFDCASLAEIQLALQSSHCEYIKKKNEDNHIGESMNTPSSSPPVSSSDDSTKRGICDSNRKSIVYANPQRSIFDLDNALELGVNALTFDSVEELQKVKLAYDRLVNKKTTGFNKSISSSAPTEASEEPLTTETPKAFYIEPPEMILRILVPDTHSTVPLGEKFGVDPNHVQTLTKKALDLNLNVIGVSFHCGSGNHDPESYREAILIAKSCIDQINIILRQYKKKDCCILDIGGGYPGYDGVGADYNRFSCKNNHKNHANFNDCAKETALISKDLNKKYDPSTETAYKIAEVVSPLIDELFPLSSDNSLKMDIISEPGRYFVEAAFAYCAKIYSAKKTKDVDGEEKFHYYIAQGVQGLFKDVILCDEVFTPLPLPMHDDGDVIDDKELYQDRMFPSTVHGPSGERYDVICNYCLLPKLKVGDWLLFDRMGAYTMSIAARNRNLSVRYVC